MDDLWKIYLFSRESEIGRFRERFTNFLSPGCFHYCMLLPNQTPLICTIWLYRFFCYSLICYHWNSRNMLGFSPPLSLTWLLIFTGQLHILISKNCCDLWLLVVAWLSLPKNWAVRKIDPRYLSDLLFSIS